MTRPNPRIDAQRSVLLELLDNMPSADDFDETDTREWQRLGMGPKFWTYNGIAAVQRLIEAKLDALDEEEAARSQARLKDHDPTTPPPHSGVSP